MLRRWLFVSLRLGAGLLLILLCKTALDVNPPHLSLDGEAADSQRFQVLDRSGTPLGVSYQTRFNRSDILPLHDMPPLLRTAFVTSEDQHFFSHSGVDWPARLSAVWQNIHARRAVRGASTITEQVVRILHPRPRTLWSRWIEGFEAILLERHSSKGEILEFYLNQVPYAANRRGVAQAARYYFNRAPDTLTAKETLALAVLPRAPSALDLYRKAGLIDPLILRLGAVLASHGELTPQTFEQFSAQPLQLQPPAALQTATHFINFIRETVPYRISDKGMLLTTLDADLQQRAQTLLNERIRSLARKQVHNGAVLIADHTTGEILAWAVAGAGESDDVPTPGRDIDAVRSPRQPGSSLKPFLYALALDSGWSPATELDDAPMAEAIGGGLHDFHNYSHTFYGKISLREALGNSLNIPALQTIGFVGPARYLEKLHDLGFASLTQDVSFYKEGLALGNGEVTLFEMVQAYCALANRGVFRPLTPIADPVSTRETKRVFSPEASSLIANILSDSFARRREFGAGSVLNLPVQTAVKTGTSTDYRDAWVMGFNSRYVVGVWLGNLDQHPMDGVTGSTGPALTLRGIFAALSEKTALQSLYLSPKLTHMEICTGGDKNNSCYPKSEYFIAGSEPKEKAIAVPDGNLALLRPTEGLQIAYDPRVPAELQAFEFAASNITKEQRIEWILNGRKLAITDKPRLLWPVTRGQYVLEIHLLTADGNILLHDRANFRVK